MRIKSGCGFYYTDNYPVGGCFARAKEEIEVIDVMLMPKKIHGCNAYGKTLDGRQVAFSTEVCEKKWEMVEA